MRNLFISLVYAFLWCGQSVFAIDKIPNDEPLCGIFSVGEGKTVKFSKGNLQFHPGTETWRFAPQQNFTCGSGNLEAIKGSDDAYWMDLFSWGTSGKIWHPTASFMYSSATYNEHSDISNTDLDWGVFNSSTDDGAVRWRTMTRNEWSYLLCHRDNAEQLIAFAQVSEKKIVGKSGIIILPDDWNPEEVSFKLKTLADIGMNRSDLLYRLYTTNPLYWSNNIDEVSWQELESHGAVFLPVTSMRVGNVQVSSYQDGWYWTSSCASYDILSDGSPDKDSATGVHFMTTPEGMSGETYILTNAQAQRFLGLAVRLVCDVTTNRCGQSVMPAGEGFVGGVFSLSADDKVHFAKGNLQYNPHLDSWQFASEQYLTCKTANSNPDKTRTEWFDTFGWSTSGKSLHMPYETATCSWVYGNGNMDIDGTMLDWAFANPISNGGNKVGLWRTPTSDEWAYLLCKRKNATSLVGLGSVNGVYGMIVLPDDWAESDAASFVPLNSSMLNPDNYYYANYAGFYIDNRYTEEQWHQMENRGAVFLPVTGIRVGEAYQSSANGIYWTSTRAVNGKSDDSHSLFFFSDGQTLVSPHYEVNKCFGLSVRPVTPVDPEYDTCIASVPDGELTDGTVVTIENLRGQCVYCGTYGQRPKRLRGVHIVRSGNKSAKVSF